MITTINSTDQSIVATELNFDEFQEIVKVINGLLVPAPKSDNNTANEDYYNIPTISLNQLKDYYNIPTISLNQLSELINLVNCFDGQTNISAINKLRDITKCSLKEAKNVIEGKRPDYKET